MKLSNTQKQELITDLLEQIQNRENDFPVINYLSELPTHFRGIAVEINDHGNVTVWNCFKNGSIREIASRV